MQSRSSFCNRLPHWLIHHFNQFDYVRMIRDFLQYLPLPHEELACGYLQSPYGQGIILGKDLAVALMRVLRLLSQYLILFGIHSLLEHLLRCIVFLFPTSLLVLTSVSLHDFVDCPILPCAHLNDYLVLFLESGQLGCSRHWEILKERIVGCVLEHRLRQCGHEVAIIWLLIP